jgi:uncharacterized protein (UPF0254 family)
MDRTTMDAVVHEMNRDGGWEIDRGVMSSSGAQVGVGATSGEKGESAVVVEPAEYPELVVDDVVAMVEEMAMLH